MAYGGRNKSQELNFTFVTFPEVADCGVGEVGFSSLQSLLSQLFLLVPGSEHLSLSQLFLLVPGPGKLAVCLSGIALRFGGYFSYCTGIISFSPIP